VSIAGKVVPSVTTANVNVTIATANYLKNFATLLKSFFRKNPLGSVTLSGLLVT